MHRYQYNVDRRPNVGLKLSRQPVCVNCNQGFAFKDPSFPIGGRCPLLLSCGHSTCEHCIRSLLRNDDKSVTCKSCSKVSTLSTKVDSADSLRSEFPLNIFVVGQIVVRGGRSTVKDNVVSFGLDKNKASSSIASNNSHDELCYECSERPAGSLCLQCKVTYCDLCFVKIHSSGKSLQTHEKIPVRKGRKSQTSGNFVFCKDHSEQKLEFFCKDCEVSTCAHCFICNHRSHDLITLKEKNAAVIKDLAAAYEDAIKVLERLHFTRKKISTRDGYNTLDEEALQTEKAVSSHFSYLHGLLQLKEAELLKDIRTAQTCTQQSLQDISIELDSTIKEVEELVSMGKAALEPNKMNNYDLVGTVTKLKDVCELPCHLVLSQHLDETTPYKFIADDITDTILDHCKISVPEAKKYYLRTKHELPDDYEIEDIPCAAIAIKKTVPGESLVIEKSLLPHNKQQNRYSYSESEISTTSTESVRSSENFHRLIVTRLMEGSVEQVTLCHLLSPQNFYVHRKSSANELLYYSKEFGKCASVKSKWPDYVTVGFIYLVKFNTDHNWYRGRVLTLLENDHVEVYYIDYGNIEKTSIKCLRMLPEKFRTLPALAIHCSLCDCIPVNGDWSSEAINVMANITNNVVMTMHIFRITPSDIYEVDLSRKEIGVLSLRDALIFLGLATLSDLTHQMPTLKKDVFLDQQIKPGTTFTGLVTTVNSPAEFYVQRLDENGRYLENLMDDMNKMYCRKFTENHLVYTPTLGMPVAAQFTVDDKWYRALVISLPGQRKVEVFYVDYGNSEVLMWDRLRILQEKFLRMSCQALKCSLCDIMPIKGSEWSTEVTSWFAAHSDKKPLQVAVIVATKPTLKVVLYEQLPHSDVCINALMVKNGYATSTGKNSTVVDFPRTIIESTTKPNIPPLMPHDFLAPKPIKTAVKKRRKPKEGSVSESSVKSEKSKASGLSSDTTSCEKLGTAEDDGEDLFRIPVTVLNVVSPALFYVSISSQEKQIKNLGAEMAEFYSGITYHNSTWAVDSKFAMLRKSDKKWYRGVIIELLTDNLAKVLLKDIASVELVETSNLMPLDEKFLSVRDGAVKCHLSGITAPGGQNVWPGIATEVFQEELEKYPQKYMSKMGDIVNDSLPVELFVKSVTVGGALEPTVVDWKTINRILVDRGFALPVRNNVSQVNTTSELIKTLEDRPSCSMEELVTNWLNKTEQASKHVPSNNLPPSLQYPTVTVPRRPHIPQIIEKTGTTPKTPPKSVSPVMKFAKPLDLKRKNTQDALLKSLMLPAKSQTGQAESYKTSNSGSSSPNLNLSLKSLDMISPTPHLSRPVADINTITEWLPAVPFKSLNFTCLPTYVDSECAIYIQDPSQSKDTLEVIHKALLSQYNDSKPLPVDLYWFPGQLCIAQYFSDQAWYRAKVLKVIDNISVEVQFVDYGNIEICKASQLRKNIFMGHIPIQCHRCTTPGMIPISSDGKWPVPALDFIHGTIVEKKCKVELKEPETPNENYVVLKLLCPGDLDLMELLLNVHYATYFIDCDKIAEELSTSQIENVPIPTNTKNLDKLPTNWYSTNGLEQEAKKGYVQTIPKACMNGLPQNPLFQNMPSSHSSIEGLYKICEDLSKIITECNGGLTYTPAVLPEADECTVEVTGVLTALDFIVQIVDCDDDENLTKMKDDFEELTREMQTEAEKLPLLEKVFLGGACCARYTQDDKWYRASITEQMEDGRFKVQYVDFGNAEILPRDRIREIKEKWTELPLQGISVHLWGIHKPRNFNPEKTGKMIVECMLSGDAPLIMKIMDRIGKPSVQFFNKEGSMVIQPLLDEKLLLNNLP